MKKTAIILFTGDRINYIDYAIDSCLYFLKKGNIESNYDIFLISYSDDFKSKHEITRWDIEYPLEDDVKSMKMTKQTLNYADDQKYRINFGIYILFNQVPNEIYKKINILEKYDYILKSRSDLVFETPDFNFKDENLYSFECFWGGCRYNPLYTNDHFIFGDSKEVLKIISYPKEDCDPSKYWNPEHYMTDLYTKSNFNKVFLNTDKYYLLSNDGNNSRKFIGFPMEKINKNDFIYFDKIGLDYKKIKFINEYDYKKNNTCIVISKYEENVEWINFIDSDIDIFLYDKSNSIINIDNRINYIKLENKGRESDTYLNYIIDNYHNLHDNIIFLQGDPFYHYMGLISFLNKKLYINNDICLLSDKILNSDINGFPDHPGLKISKVLDDLNIKYKNDISFIFAAGAQFSIKKDIILSKSLDYWNNVKKIHDKYLSEPGINGSPWIFERIWLNIFEYNL